MARIKKLKENGSTIYPGTIPQAVVDPETGKNITEIFATKNVATSSSLGLIKSGSDIVVGGDGSVRVNPMTVTRIHSMGISTAYKLFSFNSMGDKSNIVFSIVSPVLGGGAGYATYMVYRTYQGANTEKHCHPVCLYATESSMYNRVKLVRTGNQSFDVYYQSSVGNDYCNFILNCTTSTEISIVAAGVSSIPEDIYKESMYMPLHFGDIHGSLKGNADTATKATQDNDGNVIKDTYLKQEGGIINGSLWVIDGLRTPRWAMDIVNNVNDHAIEIGAIGKDYCNFYEYGGVFNFYKSRSNVNTLIARIQENGIEANLLGIADSTKSLIARTETIIDSEAFKTPGIYVAPISSITVDGEGTTLYGNSTIITIGNGSQAGYIEQIVIASVDDRTKMFYRSWDLTTEPFEFTSLLPETATQYKDGLLSSSDKKKLDGIEKTYLPKTGGTINGSLTINNGDLVINRNSNGANFTINTTHNGQSHSSGIIVDINGGKGSFLKYSNPTVGIKQLGIWTDGAPRFVSGSNIYMLYHAGNLANATTSKAGLMSNTDKSKLDGIETGATKNKVHYIHGEISDGFGTIDYSTIDDKNAWKTNEPIYFINDYFNSDKQSIPLSFGVDGTYLYITFVGVDPVNGKRFIASSKTRFTDHITSTNTLVVSYLPEGDLDSKFIKFNNSSNQINIDNYPQNDYGTITIWYNFAQADGASPGQEGVIYQTKYKSEQGEGGSGYVDCLTQLYVGSGGIKQRTVIDYDAANPFDGIPWS